MKKKIAYLISFLAFVFVIFLFNTTSYAGSQKLNSLHYDVTLNEDGTANVIENWNIRIEETNTLFKTFETNSKKYGGITNVKVSEITKAGDEIEFINTEAYAYHVQKGGYYALKRNYNEFEIAWGVSIDDTETKNYKISYKIIDAVKEYSDCSEFYWQFIGKTNGIPTNNVTGTIKLPTGINTKEDLKVWAHGPLNGNIEIIDNQTVKFEVSKLNTGTMVEVRVVTTANIFIQNLNTYSENKLSSILAEEGKWADEANAERDRANKIILGIIIIGCIIALFFILKIIKYAKELSRVKKTKIKPEMKLDYFRDFPDEDATPGEASFLYYFNKKGAFTSNVSKIVSATILNLALKKAIAFEESQEKKNNIYIVINKGVEVSSLKQDEKSIYDLLVKVEEYAKKKNKDPINQDRISMKDIENYAKKNDTSFLSKIEGLEKIAKLSEEEKGNYDKNVEKLADKWSTKSAIYFVLTVFCIPSIVMIIPLFLAIPCVICGILCFKIRSNLRTLTQKGENEREEWRALKKYMEDFSLLNEREVPELVLWEKYLVYATAFGIADKVLAQLKIRYPELQDESYMISHGYTYMYMMNRMSFDSMIVGSMQKAYTTGLSQRAARNYSSRRRLWWRILRRRRWPVVAGGRNGRKIILLLLK